MNKKSDHGWILCPSKSYPGKFYYFNVINGEAAWCLTELEKKTLIKDSTIRKVLDQAHIYPEPNTPPTDISFNTSKVCYPFSSEPKLPLSCHHQSSQVFGQPVFPKYFPNNYMMGYMLPMPPVFVANKPVTEKGKFDRVTQTSDSGKDTFVQSCTMPLSKRFGYFQANEYTKIFENNGSSATNNVNWWNTNWKVNRFGVPQGTILNSKVNNRNINELSISEGHPAHPILNNQDEIIKNKLLKEPVLRPLTIGDRTISVEQNTSYKENHSNKFLYNLSINPGCSDKMERTNQNPTSNKSCNNSATQLVFKENDDHNSKSIIVSQKFSLNTQNRLEAEIPNQICYKVGDTRKLLESNDLRFILQAKRRKCDHNHSVGKDEGTNMHNDNTSPNKETGLRKHVSFNVDNFKQEEIASKRGVDEQYVENNITSPKILDISYLRGLSKLHQKTDPWYIVVDMGVLLDDFEFMDGFVKEDITCRILVPSSVQMYIQTISVGEYAGRSRVMSARKAIRWLTTPQPHVIIQSSIMANTTTSAIDGIIDCCMQVLQRNHVVLLATDAELYNKGLSFGIQTYKVDELKASIENRPEISFKIKKIDNSTERLNNLEPCAVSNAKHLSISDTDIFKIPTAITKNRETVNRKQNKCDASTSPVIFHKVANRTEAHVESDTKIEDNIKKLSLEEDIDDSNERTNVVVMNNSRKFDGKIENVIFNPNYRRVHNYTVEVANTTQNLNSEKQNRRFNKYSLERNGNSKSDSLEKVTSISEFKMKYETQQSNNSVKPQVTNASCGRRLKINRYTIEENLRMFHVNDVTLQRRIGSRLDEWMCCYQQIMEECLTNVLMNNNQADLPNGLSAPWSLPEAVMCVKIIYADDTSVNTAADYLNKTLSSLCDKNDNLKSNVKPNDLMKVIGCSALLLNCLKTILPTSNQLQESKESLNTLLEHIQDPSTDVDIPLNLASVNQTNMERMDCLHRNITLKQPSEIIAYLKKHFPAWKDYNEEQVPQEQTQNENISHHLPQEPIRTFGKNLRAIKIDSSKGITLENVHAGKTPKLNGSVKINDEKLTHRIDTIPTIDNKVRIRCMNNNYIESDVDKDSLNAIKNRENEINIIRNVNVIHEFEKKILKNQELGDLNYCLNDNAPSKYTDNEYANSLQKCQDSFNYSEKDAYYDDILSEHTYDDNAIILGDDEMTSQDGDLSQNREKYKSPLEALVNDKTTNGNDGTVVNFNDESTNDSGYENESLHTCWFIKSFLTELGGSFKIIYNFINESIQTILCSELQQGMKKSVHDKANESQLHVSDIIGKLKQIIEREAAENTKLKSLIRNAGVEALTDKRLTRYRQVVMKCLEQAQLLEGALKTMLALTNEHCDIAMLDDDEINGDITYFNIFE